MIDLCEFILKIKRAEVQCTKLRKVENYLVSAPLDFENQWVPYIDNYFLTNVLMYFSI